MALQEAVGKLPITGFNWVDLLAVILLFRMSYVGFRTGISSELFKLVGCVAGFFVSFRYHQALGNYLAQWTFLTAPWAGALALAIGTAAFYLGLTRSLRLLERVVKLTFQDKLSRVAGLLAGACRALLVTSIVLVILRQLPSPYLATSIEEHSFSGGRVSKIAPMVYGAAVPRMHQLLAGFRGKQG